MHDLGTIGWGGRRGLESGAVAINDHGQIAGFARVDGARHEVLVQVNAAGLDRGRWRVMAGLPCAARLVAGLRAPKKPVAGSLWRVPWWRSGRSHALPAR